ncbi:WD40-repeat-containing domain protein [Baffinella frigidus]|nr:WD40-repeat-containing domain protein [Cryptophyta sp. CCMP2293]
MEALPTEKVSELKAHVGPVLAVRFNRDGNYCLTCGQDRLIKLWNPTKGLVVKTYVGHGHEVFDVATADDNSRLASVGGDKLVFYWDVATGNIIRKFRGHELRVNTVRFAGEGSAVIISGSYDKSVRIFDCRSRRNFEAVQTMRDFRDSVTSVAVSGHQVCAASVDGFIRTFDIRMGEMVSDCVGQPITCVTVTNDGNCVLATCMDSKVRLFDKSNGELLASYSGHKNSTYTVRANSGINQIPAFRRVLR